jgi:hypothetical protein
MCHLLPDIRRQSPQAPPPGLDWDFWLGPAAKEPYTPNRSHEHWRWSYNAGGSLMSDWGAHMIDIVLLAMQESDPVTVVATGGRLATNDDRDTPDTLVVSYRFPKWVLNWEHRFTNPRGLDGGKEHGAEFISDHGSLIVDRSGYRFYPWPPDREGPPPSQWSGSTHWLTCPASWRNSEHRVSMVISPSSTSIIGTTQPLRWPSASALCAAMAQPGNGDFCFPPGSPGGRLNVGI